MPQFAYSSPQTSAIAANLASIIGTPGQRQRARILGDQAGLLQAQIDQSRQGALTEIAQQGKLGAETAGLKQRQGLIGQAVDEFGNSLPNVPSYMAPALGATLYNSNADQLGDASRTFIGLNLAASRKPDDVFNGSVIMDGMPSANGAPVASYGDRDRVMGTQHGFKLNEIVNQGVADREVAEAKAAAEGNQDRLTKREFPEPMRPVSVSSGAVLTDANGNIVFDNRVGAKPERINVGPGVAMVDADGNIVFDNREAPSVDLSTIDQIDSMVSTAYGDIEKYFGIERDPKTGEITDGDPFDQDVDFYVKKKATELLQQGAPMSQVVQQITQEITGPIVDPWNGPPRATAIDPTKVDSKDGSLPKAGRRNDRGRRLLQQKKEREEKRPQIPDLSDEGKVHVSPDGKHRAIYDPKTKRMIEIH